jgi:branched-chain amino acid transport system permease protein
VKFVWDGNGANFAKATVKNAMDAFGKKFMLLTNDYVWGHDTAAAHRAVEEYGGEVIDEILVPQGTRDFSSYAASAIQQAKPDVVAAAVGGDDQKALRQQVGAARHGREAGLDQQPAGLARRLRAAADNLFGVSGPPGTTSWTCRAWPSSSSATRRCTRHLDAVPGNVFYNGYMATRELLAAIERAGSTNNIAVIKALEGHKVSAKRPPAALRRGDRCPSRTRCSRRSTSPRPTTRPRRERHVQDPDADTARGRADRTSPRSLQAGELRGHADLRRLGVGSCGRASPARPRLYVPRPESRELPMIDLVPHIVNGLTLGLLFALIALGFMLIVGVMEVINLAHGSLFALGAYLRRFDHRRRSGSRNRLRDLVAQRAGDDPLHPGARWLARRSRGGGMALELCLRPTYGKAPLYGLLLTFGAALVIEETIRLVWGTGEQSCRCPAGDQRGLPDRRADLLEVQVLRRGLRGAAIFAVWLFLEKTPYGAIIKAGSHDSEMVRALGYDLSRLRLFVFGFGAALAGLAGIIMAPIWGLGRMSASTW